MPELQAALDAASRHSVYILTNERGTNRWSYRGASAAVRKVRELDYDIHSWRHNAACELVEAGCGGDLVAAVTGQSPAMVLHYTKKVRQKVRALQAQQRRLEKKRRALVIYQNECPLVSRCEQIIRVIGYWQFPCGR